MSDLPASQALYDGIRALIFSSRQTVARGVDLLQVHTNYEIGRRIVEQEQQGAEASALKIKLASGRTAGNGTISWHTRGERKSSGIT